MALVIIWMSIIFCLSNQPANDSSRLSDGFIERTIGRIYTLFDSDDKLELIKDKYSHPVRKMAHFTIYLILGLFVFNFVKELNIRHIILLSLLVCFIYACSDEVHQFFVIGRSCELKDVLIDTSGSFIGILVYNKLVRKF